MENTAVSNIIAIANSDITTQLLLHEGDFTILFMLKGTITINPEGEDIILYPGHYYVLMEKSYEIRFSKGIYEMHYHIYNQNELSYPRDSTIFPKLISPKLYEYLAEIKVINVASCLDKRWFNILLDASLILIIKVGESEDIPVISKADKVQAMVNYIYQHLDERISLESLSRDYLMSQNSIRCLFRQEFKSTFSDYLRKIRLNKARKMLQSTDESIRSISMSVGYNAAAAFTYAYRIHFGITPKAERMMAKRISI
jgi:AraC-like DNA-binding protein